MLGALNVPLKAAAAHDRVRRRLRSTLAALNVLPIISELTSGQLGESRHVPTTKDDCRMAFRDAFTKFATGHRGVTAKGPNSLPTNHFEETAPRGDSTSVRDLYTE